MPSRVSPGLQASHSSHRSKIGNISKLSSKIRGHKAKLRALLGTEHDSTKRLVVIRDTIEACHSIEDGRFGQLVLNTPQNRNCPLFWPDFHNRLTSFINQAHDHPPASDATFEEWETTLLAHLDTMCVRLEYASLHANMVDKWLRTDGVERISAGVNEEATQPQHSSGNRAKEKLLV